MRTKIISSLTLIALLLTTLPAFAASLATTVEDGSLVRAKWSRTQIYYVSEGKKVPVAPRTLKQAGVPLSEVEIIPYKDLKKIPVAKYITTESEEQVYQLKNNKKEAVAESRATSAEAQAVAIPQDYFDSFKTVKTTAVPLVTSATIISDTLSPLNSIEYPSLRYIESPTLGGSYTQVTDTNEKGVKVGYSEENVKPGDDSGATHAFIWDPKVGMRALARPAHTISSGASAINNLGDVVGFIKNEESVKTQNAYWKNGVLQTLNTNAENWISSALLDINDDGTIVGAYYPDEESLNNIGMKPFIYENGVVQTLQLPAAFSGGQAKSINNRGDVVGTVWFVWDKYYIDDLIGVENDWDAINREGFRRRSRAVIWVDGKMIDLNTLLPDDSHYLLNAVSINNNREVTVIGWPKDSINPHIYVIKLPDVLPQTN